MAESGEPAVDAQAQAPGDPAAPRPLVNAANGLTVLRFGLVPLFVALMVTSQMTSPGYRIAAALAFLVASVTDFADGWIARSFDQVTSFGKVADPIADKALTGTALVLLSIYDRLPWWVTVVIAVREVGVTALRFWVIRTTVLPASRGGKVKTVLQILAISWYIWPFPDPIALVGPWLMAIALLVTVATGVDYVIRVLRVRRTATGQAAPL
jgi:CDP-diacylglycerol--glycerol-3-phosphate 3-phosphatidyltransferase